MQNDTIIIKHDSEDKMVLYYLIFIIIWIIIGFIAFITSLVCFGRSGTIAEKIIGLLLAIFFGPFYFLFYGFNEGYCR